jgi:hypothetical protein
MPGASRGGRWAGVVAGALVALAGAPAAADEPPPVEHRSTYSRYEQEALDGALRKLGTTIEPSPQGKIVEGVDVVTLDVIEQRDPVPNFLNWFHWKTRPYVIEREVLIARGARYQQALVDETARNLRNLPQLSLVLCVPVRGSAPDRVRILVITKDVWSIRLNSNFRFKDGVVEYLLLQPSEVNFFGLHHVALFNFNLLPASYSLGGQYDIRRIAGSRIEASLSASVIMNRAENRPEGTTGSFVYQQPLYSTRAEWAWGAEIDWRYEVTRRYIGPAIAPFDATSTPTNDAIPWKYHTDQTGGTIQVTRSFGWGVKHDVQVGLDAQRNVYRPFDLSRYARSAREEFVRTAMPVSDTRIGPYVRYGTYSTRFLRVNDFETLGLQEDYRLGHNFAIRIEPVTKALRSSRNFLGANASLTYTVPLGDGIARGYVTSSNEFTTSGLPDASIEVGARVTTPRTPIGRIVFDTRFLDRYRNYLNSRSTLGGDTRLRGYPSGMFIGQNFFAANLELRSRPVEIFTVQVGGVLFFDTGDAFDSLATFRLKHGAGFGLRLLFPQLERTVTRIDWGFPLTPGFVQGAFPGDIVVTFGQAFPMP